MNRINARSALLVRGWIMLGLSVGAGSFAAVVGGEMALAQETTQVTGAYAEEEAWFYRFRRPTDLAGDPQDPGTGHVDFVKANSEIAPPYDEGTLRVGLLNGEPEARTFLSLPSLFDLGTGVRVVGGRLTLVLHAEDDSLREPENADMVACLATQVIVSEEGARWSDQPTFACAVRTPLRPVAGSDPMAWTLDLSRFVAEWEQGAPPHGVVIVQNPQAAENDSSWHVAFRSRNHSEGPSVGYELTLRHPDLDGTTAGGGVPAPPPAAGGLYPPVFGGPATGPSGGKQAGSAPATAAPSGATAPTDLVPLGRSTQLVALVLVALAFGAVALQSLQQGARSLAAGVAPSGGGMES